MRYSCLVATSTIPAIYYFETKATGRIFVVPQLSFDNSCTIINLEIYIRGVLFHTLYYSHDGDRVQLNTVNLGLLIFSSCTVQLFYADRQ